MPVSFDDKLISAQLDELRKAAVDSFNETERVLKHFERIKGEVFTPVLNELRYAGKHIADSIVSSDVNSIRRNLFSAYRHCKRASFDVREIAISFLLVELDSFVSQHYDLEVVLSVMPSYNALRDKAVSAQSLLRSIDSDKTAIRVETLDSAINDLLEFQAQVIAKEPDIRAIENKRRRTELRNHIINAVSIGIGILGLIVGIFSIIVS